jgi:hypothetical protein
MLFSALGVALMVGTATYAQPRPSAPEPRGAQYAAAPSPAEESPKDRLCAAANGKTAVPSIKIQIYEGGAPSATVTIPGWLMFGASKLLPKVAGKPLQDRVDIDQIVELLKDPRASGVLLNVEDHKSNERVVISIVDDEGPAAVQK